MYVYVYVCVEGGASDSFASFWDPFPPTGLPYPALMRGCAHYYYNLIGHVLLISLEGVPFSEGEQRRSGSEAKGR